MSRRKRRERPCGSKQDGGAQGEGGGGERGTGVRLGGRRSEVHSQWDGGVVEGLSRGMT